MPGERARYTALCNIDRTIAMGFGVGLQNEAMYTLLLELFSRIYMATALHRAVARSDQMAR